MTTPARTIFINRYFLPDISATSRMLGGVACGLARRGRPVTVLASRLRYDDESAWLPAEESIGGVHVVRLWTTRFGRARLSGRAIDYLTFYVSALFWLLFRLRRGDLVVAKTDPPLIGVLAALPVALRRARMVQWLQDIFPEVASVLGGGLRWLAPSLAYLRDLSCRHALMNVVLGERMRGFLMQRGVDPSRLVIIPNWADPAQIVPTDPKESGLRRQYGWGDKTVVAYCGNLGRAHDHATLVDAAERLRSREDIVFLMVGGGAGMEMVKAQVTERGLKAFRFLGYRPEEELSDTLAAADVHLLCLRPELEGLIVPSKLYGIMAAARPAVFWGDVRGEVAMELDRAGAGLSVPTGNGEALALALVGLAADPVLRHRLGSAGRVAFERSYTGERAAEQWATVLDGVAAPCAA